MHDMRATIRLVAMLLAVTVVTVMAGSGLEAKTVTARVIGDGRGFEGATVRLFFDATAVTIWESKPEPVELDFAVESITDADGDVELTFEDRLSLETRYGIHLEVEAVGWATLRLPLNDRLLGTWELPEVLPLGALPLRRGHRPTGRVVSASGSPVPGAELIVVEREGDEIGWLDWLAPSHRPGAVSDSDGRFALPLLEAGSYRVVVDAADHEIAIRTVEVALGAGPIVLPLVEALPLTGRILDSEGRGLPGVDVTRKSNDYDTDSLFGDLDTVTSDGEGRFRLARGPSGPGSVSLSVSRSACRLERWSWETLRQRGGLRLDEPIRCLPPTELVVAVQESDGEPIEGAEVAVYGSGWTGPTGPDGVRLGAGSAGYGRGPVDSSTTESDGTATFNNLAPDPVTVSVRQPGYARGNAKGQVSPTSDRPVALRVELEALETREIEFRIEDHQGHPVSGARLRAEGSMHSIDIGYVSRECFLDEDGRCTIDRWPVAFHNLELGLSSAEHREYDRYTARTPPTGEPLLLTLPPPERPRLTTVVTGRIVDRRGQPVPSARLEGWFVDENGTFELHQVAEGRHYIRVSAPGFAENGYAFEIRRDTTEITIVLHPAVQIRGRLSVRDAGSDAVSHEIRVWAERDDGNDRFRGAVAGGGYTIDGAGPGPWRLRAEADGIGVDELVQIPEGVSEVVVDLELPSAPLLRGTITIDGEPCRADAVRLRSGEYERVLRVDLENGRFETRLQSNRWQLRLDDDRGGHVREIDVRGDLDVEIELQTAPIQGRVVDSATGSGIGGITVKATVEPLEPLKFFRHDWETETVTDDDGQFDFGRLITGNWTVEANLSFQEPIWKPVDLELAEPFELAAGGADVEVALVASSELEIVARYTDGEPPKVVYISLFNSRQHALLQTERRRIEAERAAGRPAFEMGVSNLLYTNGVPRLELDAEGRGTITAAPGRYHLEARGSLQDSGPLPTTSATVTIPGPPAELIFGRLGAAALEFAGVEPSEMYKLLLESRATLLEPADPAYDGPRTVDGNHKLELAPGRWQVETMVDGVSMTCDVEIVDGRKRACLLEPN